MIDHLIRELEHAVANQADSAALLRHLDGIEAVMVTHFRFEEKQLVDLLDTMAIDRTGRSCSARSPEPGGAGPFVRPTRLSAARLGYFCG